MTFLIIDLIIAGIIVLTATLSLFSPRVLNSIVFFIAFGLVISLAWVRLNAPDIAIAEAAIGAGVTGALFLVTWLRIRLSDTGASNPIDRGSLYGSLLVSILTLFLAGSLVYSLTASDHSANGLAANVHRALADSGVENPVTAVLLNYRSFDTLLEIGVLFLTMLAVRSLSLHVSPSTEALTTNPFLSTLVRVIVPLGILLGAYILWVGAYEPGGAFQAGALWAGVLILLRISGVADLTLIESKSALSLGFGVFIAIALLAYAMTGNVLAFPKEYAGYLILIIEVAAAISIAATLYLLFSLGTPKKVQS